MFAVIVAILVYGFVVARFVSTPRAVGFRLVILILLSFNILWWSVADRRFSRFIRSPRLSRNLRLLAVGFCVLLNAPILYMFVAGRSLSFLGMPTWYTAAVTLWHLGLVVMMPVVALLRLVVLASVYAVHVTRARVRVGPKTLAPTSVAPSVGLPSRGWIHGRDACATDVLRATDVPHATDVPRATDASRATDVSGRMLSDGPEPAVAGDAAFDADRRAILRTAFATVPMMLLAGATAVGRAQEGRLEVNRHTLPAPWLSQRLRGLTITHISDLHVGRHYRPYMLRQLVDKANGLDGDIVVVTGDLVDVSNDMLPPAIHALRQLTHRHGLFICIGNHDQIDSRFEFTRRVREHFPLLINQRRSIGIDGERITIAGLDYSGDRPIGPRTGHLANVAATLSGYVAAKDGPVIALSHHPHAFDLLASAGVPLTLAGHTHGGQLMLTAPGQRPDIGVGRLLFRYNRGFYRKSASTLFVNSGVGNWFPLRIRAPAEIVQLQLT